MRASLRFAVLLGLAALAAPVQAEDNCQTWVADMQEEEGGPVLMAHACAQSNDRAPLLMMCSEGTIWLQYDLALDTGVDPDMEEFAELEFVTDTGTQTISTQFQEMNAMFGGALAVDAPLVDLLKSNASVMVRTSDAKYPVRTYSLAGSSKAIATLVAQCR